jgi:CRISPR associated protein Cas1
VLSVFPNGNEKAHDPRVLITPLDSKKAFIRFRQEWVAASACGLDPGIGFLHTDTANRDSLALDLIETIRPAIEAWLLNWLLTEPLRRSDFAEGPDGSCRLSAHICSKLAETAPTWGKLVAPWAEFVAHALFNRRSAPGTVRSFKTPLTQRYRRE